MISSSELANVNVLLASARIWNLTQLVNHFIVVTDLAEGATQLFRPKQLGQVAVDDVPRSQHHKVNFPCSPS